VIPHQHREDPGQEQLVHQGGQAQQEDSQAGPGSG
jgi:hypothetical protein